MADNMKKVNSGDPLNIPAETFNTFVDSARDFKKRQRDITRGQTQTINRSETILVRNDSGADRDRYDVLGIDGVIFTPTDNADTFKNDVALKGITPATDDHAGKFVILAEPVKDGSIARAFISGVCVAYIDIDDEDHATADVKDADATSLLSCDDGAVSILWAESGTGNKWAVVRFGGGAGGAGIQKGIIIGIEDTFYRLQNGSDTFNAYVFRQGQEDFNLVTNVMPRFRIGDYLPYYKIGSTYYVNQTFTYVGNDRSIRWVEDDGLVDDPRRAGAFFRDF